MPDGGETDDEVYQRAKLFVRQLFLDFRNGNIGGRSVKVLIVSHSMLIVELMKYFFEEGNCNDLPDEEMQYIVESGRVPNGGISKFRLAVNGKGKLASAECFQFCVQSNLETDTNILANEK